jgi:predicted aldo/keto reductase-like oxidoreductase
MGKSVNRREFIQSALAVGALSAMRSKAAVDAPGRLPTRPFGRTGLQPSVLAIGCGSRLIAYGRDDRILEALELALASGITYFDTAQDYGGGRSETLVGQATKGRRQGLVLATKTHARTADEVMRRAEQSLKRLQVDHLDVMHIHEVLGPDDFRQVEAKGGALEGAYKLRDQKMVRFLGISCHGNPESLAPTLERHDFDCVEIPLNAALQGRMPHWYGFLKKDQQDTYSQALPPVSSPGSSFQDLVLPIALRKKLGIIAMKVTGQEGLIGSGPEKATASELIRYALSLPVSVVSVGMPRLEFIRENTALARNFVPLTETEMRAFEKRISAANKVALDLRFMNHRDV